METKSIDSYNIEVSKIPIQINIYSQKGEPVPFYHVSLLNITDETKNNTAVTAANVQPHFT